MDEFNAWLKKHSVTLPPASKRTPEHHHDWGDDGTVGIYLKRPNKASTFGSDHGRFLGKVDGQYHVARVALSAAQEVLGMEHFNTVEEMQASWMLD